MQIGDCLSRLLCMLWGVPQGSVLGPILFSIYSQPICDIARKYGVEIHTYADDTELYLTSKSSDSMDPCIEKMQQCISEIRDWMSRNTLKLNDDKTEVLLISTPTLCQLAQW